MNKRANQVVKDYAFIKLVNERKFDESITSKQIAIGINGSLSSVDKLLGKRTNYWSDDVAQKIKNYLKL